MENAMILLYDLCRLCLDEPGTENIFEPVDWSQDILTHTGLQMSITDKMPQTICTSCRDILNCAKILKEVALQNHTRLMAISDSDVDPKEVFVNASASHIVIIGSYDHQNENREPAEVTSTNVSRKTPSKHRIKFEDEDTVNSKAHKNVKKRKSSSKPESSAPKLVVRKDLFDSSTNVTSSTRSSQPRSTPNPSPRKDPDIKFSRASSSKGQSASTSTTEKKINLAFECETCHRNYATAKKLYLHQLSHNKKFVCPIDVCEKKFATKGDLQKHVRSHTGEKPFKCDLCEQSFTQNVTLKAHRVNIHNDAT